MAYPGDSQSPYPYSGGPQPAPGGPYQPSSPAPAPGYGPDPGYGGGFPPPQPPVSGAPITAPYSTPPVSGPGAGQMSGPPSPQQPWSGQQQAGQQPPGQRRSGPWIPVLAGTTALFVLMSIVLAVLFLGRNAAYNDEKRTVAQRDSSLQTANAEAERLKADIKRVEGERDAARRDLGGAQGQADEQRRQKQVVSRCLTLLVEALDAADKGDTATARSKGREAQPVCTEAEKYVE